MLEFIAWVKKTATNKSRKYYMRLGTEGDQLYVSHIYDIVMHKADSTLRWCASNLLNLVAARIGTCTLKHLASHFYACAKQVYYKKLCVYIYALCIHGNINERFRSFKSKENIHKKEVGPYRGFGY